MDSQCIIRPIFQLGYLPVERAFDRETTLRERIWPGAGKRMLLIPERFADVSKVGPRNGSMDTALVFGNSSVFIHSLSAAEESGFCFSKGSGQ